MPESSIKFPIHHMLVSVLGKEWRKAFVVAFTVYLDDSGTDPSQKVANATALIIPASRILDELPPRFSPRK